VALEVLRRVDAITDAGFLRLAEDRRAPSTARAKCASTSSTSTSNPSITHGFSCIDCSISQLSRCLREATYSDGVERKMVEPSRSSSACSTVPRSSVDRCSALSVAPKAADSHSIAAAASS
jgi:hypothetical protein